MVRWRRSRTAIIRRLTMPRVPRVLVFLLILLLLFYIFFLIDRNLKPAIIQIGGAKAQLMAAEAINRVLYEKVLANVNYNDLVIIHKDSQQRITMMQANTIRINRIVAQTVLEIKEVLRQLNVEVIRVPLMQAMGSQLLANAGPRINVRILPVGTVNVKFTDHFQQAGINQTRHILYLDIQTKVSIVVPLSSQEVAVTNQIPIAETIIVGQVPTTYLGLENPLTGGILGKSDSLGGR